MPANDYIAGLTKQFFATDYILNGLFPCHSDIIRSIRHHKKAWDANNQFEYRMLLAHSNTGGTLNSQVFDRTGNLHVSGNVDIGIFKATYGSVMDGINVNMMNNLETKSSRAAFATDYSLGLRSLRLNMANLFKNFAIHGRMGVLHQIRSTILAPNINAAFNPVPNVHTPVIGTPFTIAVPTNVMASGFKKGRLLIKTKEALPWGEADVSELYMILDNQPNRLSLIPVGTTVSTWEDGQFLEIAQNREIEDGVSSNIFSQWTTAAITVAAGPFAGTYDRFDGTGSYTAGADAVAGAPEGFADLFPWYSDPASLGSRLGTELPFRAQKNRLLYTTEQAGGFVMQDDDEPIMNTILRGLFNAKVVVPDMSKIAIMVNPATRMRIGYEQGQSVQVLRDNFVGQPLIYQAGLSKLQWQVANQTFENVVEDMNMPTDVILIGPLEDIAYNAWDNTFAQIDSFVQETWGKELPPVDSFELPTSFTTGLDLSKLIAFGSPQMSDGNLTPFENGSNIRQPKTVLPVALYEMGALYTEHPYAFTVVKLQKPIVNFAED